MPPAAEAAPQDTEPTRAGSPTRVVIPRAKGTPAAWVQAPAGDALGVEHYDAMLSTLAAGNDAGLVETPAGPLWLSRRTGAVGVIEPPPDMVAFAFESSGGLLGLDARGRLHRVSGYDRARSADGWTEIPGGGVHGHLLDAGGKFVVTAGASSIEISGDEGETWTRRTDVPLRRIDRVFVRVDGVVAVQGLAAEGPLRAFSWRPGDKEWRPAPHDVGRLSRHGAAIVGDGYSCVPTLSSDGRRWVKAWRNDVDWADWAMTSSYDGADDVDDQPPGISLPAAPAPDATCDGEGGGLFGIGSAGADEPIRGTPGPAPAPTTTFVHLLSDGLCNLDADGFECAEEPLVRLPHVVRFDGEKRILEVLELPAACRRPVALDSAAGFTLLRCEVDAGPSAFALGGQGSWHPQPSLRPAKDERMGKLTAAADGTLLLHGECESLFQWEQGEIEAEESCAPSWIRAPLPLDTDAAWSQLRSDTALAHRVLDGGRALKVSGSGELGYTLAVQAPTRVSRPLALINRPGHLLADAWIDWSDRTIRVVFESEPEHVGGEKPWAPPAKTPPLIVGLDGKLEDAGRVRGAWPGFDVTLGYDREIAALDFDGDGRLDVALGGRQVSMLYADGIAPGSLEDACADGRCRSLDLVDSNSFLQHLAAAGDLDGDGLDDLAVTTCTASWDDRECRVNIVYGRRTHADRTLAELDDGTGGFVIRAGRTESSWQAVGVGDIDGDGRDDLAVGRPWADVGGRVYIVYGKEDLEWVSLDDVERGVGGFVLRSRFAEARLGHAVVGLGDLDGDGQGEIAVAAPDWDDERGAVFVIRGQARSRAMPRTLEDAPAGAGVARLTGAEIGGRLGYSIAAVGDVNADGRQDLAVGAPWCDGEEKMSGRVYVVTAVQRDVLPTAAELTAGQGGFVIEGTLPNEQLGRVHGGIGDLDDDGHADLVVTSPGADHDTGWPTRVSIVSGATHKPANHLVVPGESGSPQGLVPLGDIDRDGHPDLGFIHEDPTPTIGTYVLHVLTRAPARR